MEPLLLIALCLMSIGICCGQYGYYAPPAPSPPPITEEITYGPPVPIPTTVSKTPWSEGPLVTAQTRRTTKRKFTTRKPRRTTRRRTTRRKTTRKPKTVKTTTARLHFDSIKKQCADILFILDATGSVKDDYQRQKNFIKKTIQKMTIAKGKQRAGLVLYSSKLRKKIKIKLGEHDNKVDLLKAVDELPYYSGITATGAALELAKEAISDHTRPKGVPIFVIVVTDGYSYDHVQEPAEKLRKIDGVITLVAGVASPLNPPELEIIAGDSSRVFLTEKNLDALVNAISCR